MTATVGLGSRHVRGYAAEERAQSVRNYEVWPDASVRCQERYHLYCLAHSANGDELTHIFKSMFN